MCRIIEGDHVSKGNTQDNRSFITSHRIPVVNIEPLSWLFSDKLPIGWLHIYQDAACFKLQPSRRHSHKVSTQVSVSHGNANCISILLATTSLQDSLTAETFSLFLLNIPTHCACYIQADKLLLSLRHLQRRLADGGNSERLSTVKFDS